MDNERLSSYPHIWPLGHRELDPLLNVPVIAEEKIDGSQISFGRIGDDIYVRSRGAIVPVPAPDGHMFKKAVEEIVARKDLLVDGWTYRGEYLSKPKHTTLAYRVVPRGNIIVFDIEASPSRFLSVNEKPGACARIDFQCIPYYGEFKISTPGFSDTLNELLTNESILGGPIEGVVLKPANGDIFGRDGKLLIAKIVRAEFKERHAAEWKSANPSNSDVIAKLVIALRTEARWSKVVQHLRDDGKLQGSMRDIPALLTELTRDVLEEESKYIEQTLWKHCWPQIERGIRRGLPEFYKSLLMNEQLTSRDPAVIDEDARLRDDLAHGREE